MTLTEMLEEESRYLGGILHIDETKEIFKRWLREIPLGGVLDKSPLVNDARHDFILMVDEP